MSLGISTRRFLRVSLTLTRSVFMVDEGVRKGGVEPPKPFGYRILSPARLPVPPLSHAPVPAYPIGRFRSIRRGSMVKDVSRQCPDRIQMIPFWSLLSY